MDYAIYVIGSSAIALVAVCYNVIRQRGKKKEPQPAPMPESTHAEKENPQNTMATDNPQINRYEEMTQRQRLLTVLKEMNCQPEEDPEEPERINVAYQGERFIIDYSEQSKYISIYDVWWYNAPLNDIEQLSDIRKVVNACNFDNHTTLVYTINTEENVIGIHSRQSMVFVPEIPNLKDYLSSQFVDSFRQHQNFHARLNALKGQSIPTDNK